MSWREWVSTVESVLTHDGGGEDPPPPCPLQLHPQAWSARAQIAITNKEIIKKNLRGVALYALQQQSRPARNERKSDADKSNQLLSVTLKCLEITAYQIHSQPAQPCKQWFSASVLLHLIYHKRIFKKKQKNSVWPKTLNPPLHEIDTKNKGTFENTLKVHFWSSRANSGGKIVYSRWWRETTMVNGQIHPKRKAERQTCRAAIV